MSTFVFSFKSLKTRAEEIDEPLSVILPNMHKSAGYPDGVRPERFIQMQPADSWICIMWLKHPDGTKIPVGFMTFIRISDANMLDLKTPIDARHFVMVHTTVIAAGHQGQQYSVAILEAILTFCSRRTTQAQPWLGIVTTVPEGAFYRKPLEDIGFTRFYTTGKIDHMMLHAKQSR